LNKRLANQHSEQGAHHALFLFNKNKKTLSLCSCQAHRVQLPSSPLRF
jgi:hypothetical protein